MRWQAFDSDFLPAKNDNGFKQWSQKGTTGYWIMSNKSGLKRYMELSNMYNFGKHDLFRYFQLRHYFDRNITFTEETNDLVKTLLASCKGNAPEKQITIVYKCLQFIVNAPRILNRHGEKEARTMKYLRMIGLMNAKLP